jgi:hypothetical protein
LSTIPERTTTLPPFAFRESLTPGYWELPYFNHKKLLDSENTARWNSQNISKISNFAVGIGTPLEPFQKSIQCRAEEAATGDKNTPHGGPCVYSAFSWKLWKKTCRVVRFLPDSLAEFEPCQQF